MFIFDWFKSSRRVRENEVPEHLAPEGVPAKAPVAPLDEVRAAALTQIWVDRGEVRETMPEGTTLWHVGTVSKADEMDDARSLWCTRNGNDANHYDGWARRDARRLRLHPYRLTLATARSLELANFGGASLCPFTREHCDSQHELMKTALRDWCLVSRFDGVMNINCGFDEVVICRPAQDLIVKVAESL